VNSPAKTFCGLYQGMASLAQVCDGSGNCGRPTVTCGLDGECSTADHACCATGPASTACVAGNRCNPQGGGAFCDEAADCPPGYVCCSWTNPGGSGVSCMATGVCVTGDFTFSGTVVCNPSTPGDCGPGTTCQAAANPPPYFACKPGP
jgi:hypothetical protein